MAAKPPNAPLRRSPWRTSCRTQARLNKRALRWIDMDKIGQELAREYFDIKPDTFSDAELQSRITSLKSFNDSPYPPNALYLDLIREAWDDALNSAASNTIIKQNLSEADGTS